MREPIPDTSYIVGNDPLHVGRNPVPDVHVRAGLRRRFAVVLPQRPARHGIRRLGRLFAPPERERDGG